jgi:hypothetical protein
MHSKSCCTLLPQDCLPALMMIATIGDAHDLSHLPHVTTPNPATQYIQPHTCTALQSTLLKAKTACALRHSLCLREQPTETAST